ncbi:MAG: methylenetetrahydrofolate--tRNA-(uracil(54)-C(5))-methyltransferase (FADH(2)-oxidizing) TrmFO [Erysipelotrichaceae bacterium]
MMKKTVNIIGGGFAGCEAAYQLIKRGIKVNLYDMKPRKFSPAHHSENLCELVCSNSFRSDQLENGVGILKEEMRHLDSLIMKMAEKNKVPAGSALAVDRDLFASDVTNYLKNHPLVNYISEEVTTILDGPTIIASGPLTSDALSTSISDFIEKDYLHFFDAAAPIVTKDSIDMNYAYFKSRYDKGDSDYLNCPMNKEEYDIFYRELINAKCVEFKDFELKYFEGCMPFEEMANRGYKTLLYGPLKPVGLGRDKDDKPYAVVQLRQDNVIGSLFNIVGFQTHLTWGEQKRILSLIPALRNCEIVRYGVMHRNTYMASSECINNNYQSLKRPDLFFAGQLTGVEGYIESCASGLLAALNMYLYLEGKDLLNLDNNTMIGAMARYVSSCDSKHFQPMNANFGIVNMDFTIKKDLRKRDFVDRSLTNIDEMVKYIDGTVN